MDQQKTKAFRPIPGLSREAEEAQFARIIGIAQDNLEKAEKYSGRLSDELHELMETYGTKDNEALALFHNTQAQLQETRMDLLRCRKARHKPYFGRIDFRDQKIPYAESYYVGRVGISRNGSEPVVIDWRAPIASVYYENTTGRCRYTVKNEGSCEIDLKRKRTYEIADDRLIDFFDSDVVANDELLTKYLARNKSAVLGEIISTIQKEQNAVIRRSPKMNLIVQGVAGSGKTTVAMHRISYILYNYEEAIPEQEVILENGVRIMRKSTVRNCLNDNPFVSMQGKINMLNAILLSRLENEITGKDIAYPPAVRKELYKKYRRHFGMMAYSALYYCLRGCTYTIMGDVSQNIHYGYGLNDWEDLKSLMLKGTPGGFGVLKKSYRNTIEISEFATRILRHGSFPVYPADPIRRHGSPVRITQCRDEEAMIRESINTIRKWQSDGRETIAVICRDEEEAAAVSASLGRELELADTDPETAEFTEGIMVLPVEYTKGLEFDAVLLYHPSAESYPAEDTYVKLLYVAATRALHELAAVHTGDLTDLIAQPAPEREQERLPEEKKPREDERAGEERAGKNVWEKAQGNQPHPVHMQYCSRAHIDTPAFPSIRRPTVSNLFRIRSF